MKKEAKRRIVEQVKARLIGDEEYEARVITESAMRRTLWYQRWDMIAEFLTRKGKMKATPEEILELVYGLVEDCKGHGKKFIAKSSRNCLELVMKERKIK